MSVIISEKNILNWNQRLNMYKKSIEFSKTEIVRQRQLSIEDFSIEIRKIKIKYNDEYVKSLENNFQKWLENDIEIEKTMYI
jgi:hypothetical protein